MYKSKLDIKNDSMLGKDYVQLDNNFKVVDDNVINIDSESSYLVYHPVRGFVLKMK